MTRQFAFITLATLLAAPWSIEVPVAQAGQQCSAAMPSNPQGHWWSYRLINGRKCWYEGKPGLSKSLLEWPKEVSTQPASSEEMTDTIPEKSHNPLDAQAWAPNSPARAPTDPDTFETRWRTRATIETPARPDEAASVTGTRPATPEVDDVLPPRKADRLQSPDTDSRQVKSIRTLLILPDPATQQKK
jgi:hypothetical protein